MFDIGWSEIALIGIVAVVVIGPKELPGVMKQVAKFVRAARRTMRQFQSHVDDIVQAEELRDIKKQLEANGITDFHEQINRELQYTAEQMQSSLDIRSRGKNEPPPTDETPKS